MVTRGTTGRRDLDLSYKHPEAKRVKHSPRFPVVVSRIPCNRFRGRFPRDFDENVVTK